jgi:hypothetical protein
MLIDPFTIAEWATGLAGASQDGSWGGSTLINAAIIMLLEGILNTYRQGISALALLWLDEADPIDLTAIATVENLRSWMLPFVGLVAVGGILWQALQMIITRKPQPLVHIGRGIWNTALWGVVAVTGTNLAMAMGDGYSSWVIGQALGETNKDRWNDQWISWGDVAADALGIIGAAVLAILAMIGVLIQVILLLFRELAIVILVGVIQLAAAGSFTTATSPWLKKIITWLVTLVLYKPIAATCYAIGMSLWGESYGNDLGGLRTMLMGMATILMAIVALPVMFKYFSWTTGALSEGGGFAALAGAAGSGWAAASMRRASTDTSTAEHVRFMNNEQGPPPSQAAASPPPPPPPPPGGGGQPATTPSGSASTTNTSTSSTTASSTGSATVPTFQGATTTGATTSTASTASTAGSAAAGGATFGTTVAIEVAGESAKQGKAAADRAGDGR